MVSKGFAFPTNVPTSRIVVALPAALFLWFCSFVPAVSEGETFVWQTPWIPQLGVSLSLAVDGLSLLFALLITGLGTFIFLYASEYMRGFPQRGRFTLFLVAFMLSMLGIVLADDLVLLFVFWEGTTLTSFLLIGYFHENRSARRCALQGLLVTGVGGLAMLAGFVLLGSAGGSYSIRELLALSTDFTASPVYVAIAVLVLAGAFTKSAQFPFHFWLPNAMAAPTPVSAYLHSATMVKAGVYLMARLTPLLGGTAFWMDTLTAVGAVTAVYSSVIALTRRDLKQVLAYTTIMALGTCTMFLGLAGVSEAGETSYGPLAAVTFILVHALYKAPLFMAAGAIDKATGTRDLAKLGGLRRVMPRTFLGVVLAALAMAGAPPFLGFLAKDLLYTSAMLPGSQPFAIAAIFVAAALVALTALILAIKPFFGHRPPMIREPKERNWAIWSGPVVVGTVGLIFGLLPEIPFGRLLVPAAAAAMGSWPEFHSDPWHGTSTALALSGATLGLALLLYWKGSRFNAWCTAAVARLPMTGDRAYDACMTGIARLASWQTGHLQSGSQRRYLSTVFLTLAAVLSFSLVAKDAIRLPSEMPAISSLDLILFAAIAIAALVTTQATYRLLAICSLGVVGTGTALLYLQYGAPDVAMTQLIVETLIIVIMAIVLLKLPGGRLQTLRIGMGHWRDIGTAAAVGLTITLLLLGVTAEPPDRFITEYFEQTTVPEGFGRNIVNVILVDFRAFDTLGEITVLTIAGVAAVALLLPRRRLGYWARSRSTVARKKDGAA